jgi:ubiquinone/menaquinone biosynthesis C-methylase UbiE
VPATFNVKQLGDERLANFDHDYVSDAAFDAIAAQIDLAFPDGRFTFLDVGGGKGFLASAILDAYPEASGVVLDNSALLLAENVASPRKRLVFGSGTDLRELFPDERFDVVFFNFALHHFIGRGYGDTRRLQRESLRAARTMLSPRGRIAVSEISYNGPFAPLDNLPSHVVFALTASTALAPLVARLGANTAGTGVCFLSRNAWRSTFAECGLRIDALTREEAPARGLAATARLAAVGAADVSNAHFWLSPAPT